MTFNSLSYAIFLPVVFMMYWLLPERVRWMLLLAASYFFYMSWKPEYVLLILLVTLISFLSGLLLEMIETEVARKIILLLTLLLCLGILFVFKYYNFAVITISNLFHVHFRLSELLLPVGISFYTFQAISYVIDVYHREIRAEKHLGVYSAYVSFFPQLVAGPIERPGNLLPQIKKEHHFRKRNAYFGMRLILWGLFKKMVIADNLAVYADHVFDDIYSYSGCTLLLAAFFFMMQIYCDFSGYSDIARGSARLLDIRLMSNFHSPYLSTSLKEFWQRWHISLSSWFRDYVYFPLGGNRGGWFRTCCNILIVFLLSGLWHGADWHFVIWGGVYGIGLILEKAFVKGQKKEWKLFIVLRGICTFIFVFLAWVIFRAENIQQSLYVIRNMLQGILSPVEYFSKGMVDMGLDEVALSKIILFLLPLFIVDFVSLKTDVWQWLGERNVVIRHAAAISLILAILFFGYVGQSTFVYFQF